MANVGTLEIKFSELDIFQKMLTALEKIRQQGHGEHVHDHIGDGKFFNEFCPGCIAEKALEEALQEVSRLNGSEAK
jgi:hypothetical protein